ncbi:MAG TPA: YIP1 family protein [Ignavibacteriaceae bacterium]|nr:YIP1 family protein [Ignavibacteriaceae bacterium]
MIEGNQIQNESNTDSDQQELSHTDKISGIFTEPKKTFEVISKFPPKTSDWLVPVLILLLVISLTRILVMSNEEIYFQFKEKQVQQVEKMFDGMVAKGQMTREQADEQLEKAKERMEMGRGPVGYIIQTIGIIIVGFIVYLIVVVIYFALVKLFLKGEGNFSSALVANGLPAYIIILQVIAASILSLAMGRLLNDTSAASFMNLDKAQLSGFFLGKIDPFSIWIYSVVSIGLAKMFKSSSAGKYFALVFGIWIIGSFLIWLLGKAVPFLSFLSEM